MGTFLTHTFRKSKIRRKSVPCEVALRCETVRGKKLRFCPILECDRGTDPDHCSIGLDVRTWGVVAPHLHVGSPPARLRTSIRHRIRMWGVGGKPNPVQDLYKLRTRLRTSMRHRIRMWGVVARLPRQPSSQIPCGIRTGCHVSLPLEVRNRARSHTVRTRLRSMRRRIRMWGVVGGKPPRLPRQPTS